MVDKNKKMMVGAGAGILVLLCCICLLLAAGGYWYKDQIMAMLGLAPAQKIARLLPEDTQFYASLSPSIQDLPGYQNLKKLYLDNPDVKKVLEEFEQEMGEEANITFENDIKPWLGQEIAMAAPDITASFDTSASTPSLVFAAESTDQEASNNFIEKVKAEALANNDNPFTEEVYQEVTLHIQEGRSDVTIITFFDNFVVIGNDKDLIQSMIDKSQGTDKDPSLADSPKFQKVMAEVPAKAVFNVYMSMSDFFSAALAESAVELPPESTQDLEALEAVAMAGTLQDNGIQIDVAVSYDMEKMSDTMKESLKQPASPNAILNDIPAEAIFVYNAHNLNNIWQQSKKGLESNPDFSEGMQDLEEELGFSLDEDVFGWMTGEFAVVLLEAAPPNEYAPGLGGYALIGTDDVDQARQSIDKVIGSLEEQQMLPPLEVQTIDGLEMQVYEDYDGAAGIGFHKNYFLMAYLKDSIKAAASASQNPITNSENFKTIQSRLPGQNYGYFYVDTDRIRAVAEKEMSDYDKEEYEQYVRPFVEPIHAVGAAGDKSGFDRGIGKGVFFILISE